MHQFTTRLNQIYESKVMKIGSIASLTTASILGLLILGLVMASNSLVQSKPDAMKPDATKNIDAPARLDAAITELATPFPLSK